MMEGMNRRDVITMDRTNIVNMSFMGSVFEMFKVFSLLVMRSLKY